MVVEKKRPSGAPPRRSSETVPVRCGQLPSPHGQRVNLAFRGQHSLHQLLRGHLEAEEQHLAPQLDADVLGDRERERCLAHARTAGKEDKVRGRSEEHTSELQSLAYLVCRLLLEKKKNKNPTQ